MPEGLPGLLSKKGTLPFFPLESFPLGVEHVAMLREALQVGGVATTTEDTMTTTLPLVPYQRLFPIVCSMALASTPPSRSPTERPLKRLAP